MFVLRLAVFLIALGFALFVITQVLVPAFNGTKLFPLFSNKKRNDALDEVMEAATDLEVEQIKEVAAKLREKRSKNETKQ